MNTFKKSIVAGVFYLLLLSFSPLLLTSCSDANEYEDAYTNNPSWVDGYTDSLKIAHPQTLANTSWVRGSGLKVNAYGEDIQGFVESMNSLMSGFCPNLALLPSTTMSYFLASHGSCSKPRIFLPNFL